MPLFRGRFEVFLMLDNASVNLQHIHTIKLAEECSNLVRANKHLCQRNQRIEKFFIYMYNQDP